MEVEIFEMSMTLGEADLGRHSANLGISIHPHGTEEIGFDFPSGPGARQTLAELERGDVNSVSYSVEGRVRTAQGDNEAFTQSGYLYPVPGRPGQFRGAGPQRDRPRDS
jgi:hypothetical protein